MRHKATFDDNVVAWEFAKWIVKQPQYRVTDYGIINNVCYIEYTTEEE